MALNNLGIRYSEVGRRQDALAPAEEAVQLYRELARANPAFLPNLAISLNNLGNRYSEAGFPGEGGGRLGGNDRAAESGRAAFLLIIRAGQAAAGHPQAAAWLAQALSWTVMIAGWPPRYISRRVVTGPPTRPAFDVALATAHRCRGSRLAHSRPAATRHRPSVDRHRHI